MAFGGFSRAGEQQPVAEINMIPLIDVMLVLLVIFIVTAPLLTHAVKIDLPRAQAQAISEKTEPVTLAIDDEGRLFWNNQPVDRATLSRELTQVAQRHPQPALHVRADRDTRYQLIAEVVAEAARAGVGQVGLVTDPGTAR